MSIFLKISPSLVSLRSKSAKGCDLWCAGDALKKFPFCVEAKALNRLNIFKAFKQARYNTWKGMLPLVLAKSNRTDDKEADHLAVLTLVDFFTIMYILNKICPTWYDDFPEVKHHLQEMMPCFSSAKESFMDEDLLRVWKEDGEEKT